MRHASNILLVHKHWLSIAAWCVYSDRAGQSWEHGYVYERPCIRCQYVSWLKIYAFRIFRSRFSGEPRAQVVFYWKCLANANCGRKLFNTPVNTSLCLLTIRVANAHWVACNKTFTYYEPATNHKASGDHADRAWNVHTTYMFSLHREICDLSIWRNGAFAMRTTSARTIRDILIRRG